MFFAGIISLALASLVVAQPLAQQAFTISPPRDTLQQCVPAMFSWTPTVAPYHLTIYHADSYSSHFIAEQSPIIVRSAAAAAWIVDYPAGTTVRVHIRDAVGQVSITEPMMIGEGYTDCM